MLKTYQILTTLLMPLIRIYLFRRKIKGKEDPIRFRERFGYASKPRPNGKLIWVHGASVGESISILPLIEKLTAKYTDINFLITTGTVTSAKLIASRLPSRTIHQYIPVDLLPYVKRFLNHWKPDLSLWVESELWPNLITQASKNCPLILINGRMSEKSYKNWQKHGFFIQELLGSFSLLLAQSNADATRLKALGANNVKYSGNIKYDAPQLHADENKLSELTSLIGNRPVWVAASTHNSEEKIIASTHKELKKKYPNIITVIIPRHITRTDEILNDISNGLLIATRSRNENITETTDIYLADTMGELGIFYRIANIVFIGGSLVPHGGQNPLEAARLGCAIIIGPHTFNFSEIKREFEEKDAIITITNETSLTNKVDELLSDNNKTTSFINAAYAVVNENNGIIEKIIGEISPYIENKNAA